MRTVFGIRWMRVARLGLAALTGTVLALLSFLAYASWRYADNFAHPGCLGALESLEPQGYASDPVVIETARGYQLRGWLARGSRFPEVVIVVLPGISGNTQFALPDAALLARAGFGTLMYEHRSCANPDLIHTGGYLESDDLVSAVEFLHARSDVQHVGVLGFSAGGTAALLAAAKTSRIEAVVAMGGFSSLDADILRTQAASGLVNRTILQMVVIILGFEMGVAPSEVNPAAHIAEIYPRPVLLIYGEHEADHGQALFSAAREPKELWIVPGVGHGGYREAFPREYEERIAGFFLSAFPLGP
jgi:dienelactone hydrolase